MKKRWLCCFLMFCAGSSLAAGDLSRSRAEMKTLSGKIDDLQRSLNQNIENEKSVTAVLDKLEFEQSGLRKEIKGKQAEKTALETDLKGLKQQTKELESQSEDARQRLGGLLKSGYILGKQSALRMFVNQQNPHTAARRLTMFRYVVEGRNRQLEQFAVLQASLEENRALSERKRNEMTQTISALDGQKASLAEKETLRLQEREKLRLAMADNTDELAGYRQRQKSLEKLIKQLSRPKPKPVIKPKAVAQPTVQPKTEPSSITPEDNAVVSVNGVSSGASR